MTICSYLSAMQLGIYNAVTKTNFVDSSRLSVSRMMPKRAFASVLKDQILMKWIDIRG